MTNHEQKRYAENFLKRRTSRIVNLQNGHQDQMANFSYPYNGDSQSDTVDSSVGSPTDTSRVDSIGDSDWQGTVAGGSNDDSPIYGAIDIIQRHIESLGNDDLLDRWASTANALKKTVSSGMSQASPNVDGVTEGVRHVSDNDNSSKPGPHGYISTSELSKMENEAGQLTKMSSRIANVTAL